MANETTVQADIGQAESTIGVASQLTGIWKLMFQVAAVGLGAFAIWSAGPGIAEDQIHLGVYTLVTWFLALLIFPWRKELPWVEPGAMSLCAAAAVVVSVSVTVVRLNGVDEIGAGVVDWLAGAAIPLTILLALRFDKSLDLAMMALAVLCTSYYMWEFRDLADRSGAWSMTDLGVAWVAMLLSLEVARRALGLWIPGIGIFALFYAYYGPLFPESIAHGGDLMEDIVNYIFYSQDGIFGVMTNVMAQFVLIFIYLGAFMQTSGMGRFFIELPLSIAGRSAGGPAKVAVLASSIFGSISGSSLANIVSTGTFTIPLMKRVGFRPVVAGAVENTASLGGQLLPPVMGSGVFIMAEITGVPYLQIISVAAVPALIYMFSIAAIVHFEAKRNGIEGLPESEMRSPGEVFREGWFHLLPFAVLLGLLIANFSPDYCAVMAMASVVVINWLRFASAKLGFGRMTDRVMNLRLIVDTLVTGTRNSLLVGGAAGAVGVIVGMIAMTSLGLQMSLLLVDLAGGSLFLTVALVAATSLLLGMALPITASYLVLIVLAGPAFEQLGVPLLAAHLIVFWLSQDSNITPPVCLGAFVAASIAGGDPWKTGWMSFRFAKMLYIMPLLFAYTPILNFDEPVGAVWTMLTATVGAIAFAAWTRSYFLRVANIVEWWLLLIAAAACFLPFDVYLFEWAPGYGVNIAGAALLAAVYGWQRQTSNRLSN